MLCPRDQISSRRDKVASYVFIQCAAILLLTNVANSATVTDIPMIVMDESSADWVIEPYVGSEYAGQHSFYNGPALQVGGIGRPERIAFSPDGTAYFKSRGVGVIMVTPTGDAKLLMNEQGAVEGPVSEAAGGDVTWNPKDQSLYLTGPDCIRRMYAKADGSLWVELIAGKPNVPGNTDGPAKEATLTSRNFTRLGDGEQAVAKDFCATSTGAIYFSDGGIRKLENGIVSTITKVVKGFMTYNESDNVFYLKTVDPIPGGLGGDVFNPATGVLSLFVGMPKYWVSGGYPSGTIEYRFGKNADGPALTHASFNSNFADCIWDPYHKALWVGGPDEDRHRWVKNGWIKTVLSKAKGKMMWTKVVGIDYKGRVYMTNGDNPVGVWRAYNTKEVTP